MTEDTIKYVAIGGSVLLLLFVLAGSGGRRRGGPDVEATLESMRISSATNIAYAQAGVENARIQADLTAAKDRNRSTIAIAGIENETVRQGVRAKTDIERFAIAQGRAMFQEGLAHELGMSHREQAMRRMELGAELKRERHLTYRETVLERIRAKAITAAAARGVAVQIGQQAIDRQAGEYSFIQGLLQQTPQLIDAFGRGIGTVRNAFGYHEQPARYGATYNTLPRGNTGYPGGVTVGMVPYTESPPFYPVEPSDSQRAVGVAGGALSGAAAGAALGPIGAGVGAAVGAGAGAAGGGLS